MFDIVKDVKVLGYVEILLYCWCYIFDIMSCNFNLCGFVECIVMNMLI